MRFHPNQLPAEVQDFLTERHLATLALVVSGDELHTSAVGFMWEADVQQARVITWADAKKVRLIEAAGSLPASVTQIDGGRWLSLHGRASVTADAALCAAAVEHYEQRYRPARELGDDRRTIVIDVDHLVGRA